MGSIQVANIKDCENVFHFQADRLCSESGYYKKYIKFPITNKTGKLIVKIKELFCKNVFAINNWKTVILKDAVVTKSDIF